MTDCCRTNKEKTLSEQCSSLLNEAYSCLLSPLKRAEYLLKLRGNAIEEPKMFSEPSFLNEMMHLNEEVSVLLSHNNLFFSNSQFFLINLNLFGGESYYYLYL